MSNVERSHAAQIATITGYVSRWLATDPGGRSPRALAVEIVEALVATGERVEPTVFDAVRQSLDRHFGWLVHDLPKADEAVYAVQQDIDALEQKAKEAAPASDAAAPKGPTIAQLSRASNEDVMLLADAQQPKEPNQEPPEPAAASQDALWTALADLFTTAERYTPGLPVEMCASLVRLREAMLAAPATPVATAAAPFLAIYRERGDKFIVEATDQSDAEMERYALRVLEVLAEDPDHAIRYKAGDTLSCSRNKVFHAEGYGFCWTLRRVGAPVDAEPKQAAPACPNCGGTGRDAHRTRPHGTPPLPCARCEAGKEIARLEAAGSTLAVLRKVLNPEKRTYVWNNQRHEIGYPHLSDRLFAGKVRMLTPSDLEWEPTVSSARDRIMHLSEIVEQARVIVGATPAQPAPPNVPPELDVRKIMLNVVPGPDGTGVEIYAKNVEDVENKLTEMSEKIQDQELKCASLQRSLDSFTGKPS